MDAHRYFIRLFRAGIENWLVETTDVTQLAKLFDLAEPEQSVYAVANGEEEWLTAAAHCLANPKQGVEATSVLRMPAQDLEQFGIAVDPSQRGTTGVVWIDCRHRNLRVSRDQLVALVGYLAEACRRGHDRVRRITKEHVARSLQRIGAYTPAACPPHVQAVAAWISKKAGRPVLDLERVREELRVIELPDEEIRPRAAARNSGHAVADWYAAVHELRQAYSDYYLGALAKRFGIR